MVNKFYEFHNGTIVRLDKVVAVHPVQNEFTNKGHIYFTLVYDIKGENTMNISKHYNYYRHLLDTNPVTLTDLTIHRWKQITPEEEQFYIDSKKDYEQHEYADFIKAWKEYNG